jgi:hypothetical protein
MLTLPVALSMLSIVIAICAFSVAARNFYLSRFQHVRCFFGTHMTSDAEFPNGELIFTCEVESWGLPVWDMKVVLEVAYRGRYGVQFGQVNTTLEPVGSLPNPLNAGQVAKFRLTRARVVEMLKGKRTRGISDLPAEDVWVCIYGSAERRISYYNRAFFGYKFSWFDSVDAAESERQAKRFSNWFKLTVFRIHHSVLRQRPRTHEEYLEWRSQVMRAEAERERRAASDGRISDVAKGLVVSIRANGLTEQSRKVVRDAMNKVCRNAWRGITSKTQKLSK